MNVNTVIAPKEVVVQGSAPFEATTATKTKPIEPVQKKEPILDKKQEGSSHLEEVKETADALNEYMGDLQTNLGFFIHEDLDHQVIVEIKNKKTNELVKQIPSEEIVMIREKMAELTGLLFDGSV